MLARSPIPLFNNLSMYFEGKGRNGKVTPQEVIEVAHSIVATQDTLKDIDRNFIHNTVSQSEGFRTRDPTLPFELAVSVIDYEHRTRFNKIFWGIGKDALLRAVIEVYDLHQPTNSREIQASAVSLEVYRGRRPNAKIANKLSIEDMTFLNDALTRVLGERST